MSRSPVEAKVCHVPPDCAVASGLAGSALALFFLLVWQRARGFNLAFSNHLSQLIARLMKKTSPACMRDTGTVEWHALCQNHSKTFKECKINCIA